MMGLPTSVSDSRVGSIIKQFGGESGGRSRLLACGSLAVFLLSTGVSVVAYGFLPDQVRIHWTLGIGSYYGPEFAPTVLILAAFPVLIASLALLASWVEGRLPFDEEVETIRPYYVVAMLGTLGILLGSQIVLIIANL